MFNENQMKALTTVCDAALRSGGLQVYGAVVLLLGMLQPQVPPEMIKPSTNGSVEKPGV